MLNFKNNKAIKLNFRLTQVLTLSRRINRSSPTCNSDASITRFKLVPINGLTEIKEENVAKNKILVYPNPTNKFLNFSLDKIDNHMFEVYNTLGQIIISGKIINNENSVDVSGLKQGLYFLNIYSKNQSVTTKFIKID